MELAFSSLRVALFAVVFASCGGEVAVDALRSREGEGGATCDDFPVPATFKHCTTNSDCTIAFTYVDCCGTVAAVGINGSALGAQHAFEKACNPHHPTCDCDIGPARTDDGHTTTSAKAIQVACDEGRCLTVVE